MKTLTLILFLVPLNGCALLDSAADKAVVAVNYYCDTVPATNRGQVREEVNQRLSPRSILVDCADEE